jgi:hypothetical protein
MLSVPKLLILKVQGKKLSNLPMVMKLTSGQSKVSTQAVWYYSLCSHHQLGYISGKYDNPGSKLR